MRLFFGFSVSAPWPHKYPEGRLLPEEDRHITLAFLGDVEKPPLETIPLPPFSLGPAALCDHPLFLPEKTPRVVANHIHWLEKQDEIASYRKQLLFWLNSHGYAIDTRPFLPHLSIARAPFTQSQWEDAFEKIPAIITGVHLYESAGNLHYPTIWSHPLTPLFEEFEHTADIAFTIRATSFEELYLHAVIALSFKFPPILDVFEEKEHPNLDTIVQALNHIIYHCDKTIGCPFKAVSHHGKLQKTNNLLQWEMIVDV